MSRPESVPGPDLERPSHGIAAIGAFVPGWVVRGVFFVLGATLGIVEGTSAFWSGVVVVLAATAVVVPRWMTAWVMLVVLAGTVLTRHPDPLDWHPYVLVAGVHAAHLIASWMLVAPARSRVQLRALAPTAARFVAIQVPTQLLIVATLWLASATTPRGALPAIAVVAAGALGALALVLLAPLLRERRP
ncbi:hypothetical protein ACPPVQ_11290 [Diaminobutyricibacter sp. McL0618]|uniref:hypothetical protein n=1 Tax=Leifsonia sp. McL0618 TaxID=3415677 RepID=UPI003CE7F841